MATGFEWIIGLGLMFALALMFTLLTSESLSTFFVWLLIFDGIMVWCELLPLWSLILCLIILIIIIYIESKNNLSSG